MVRTSLFLLFAVAGSAADACPSFGFETTYLSDFFCGEFGEITGPTTRDMDLGGDGAAPSSASPRPMPGWMDLPIVEEAWRVDPAATLELIERIRAAGGRALN